LTREQAIAEWPRGAAGMETDFPEYDRHIARLTQLPAWELARGCALRAPALLERAAW